MTLWRVEEAAEYLGIKPKTLYEWVRTGRVPHRKLGFNVRFDPEEIRAWVKAQAQGSTGSAASPVETDPRREAVVAPPPGLDDLIAVAREAAAALRRLDVDVGAQLSFPQRQAIRELAERLETALDEAG